MLTILHILEPEPEGTIGGADIHVLELAKFQNSSKNIRSIVFVNQNTQFIQLLKESGVEYIFFDRKLGFFAHVQQLGYWLSNNKISIIHSHGYDANFITCILRILYTKGQYMPIVMTCHGWIRNNFITTIKTYLDMVAIKMADALIYVSSNIMPAKNLKKTTYCTYIPNSVYEREIKEFMNIRELFGLPTNHKLIGYVGRLSPEKRIDVFLRSCQKVLEEYSEVRFIIVGAGAEENNLKSMAQTLGIRDKIAFAGLILDFNTLSNVYHQIDFLVQTSDTETTSRVVLEAMSSKKPIIATDVGDMRQLILHKKNGFLVKSGDYHSTARYCIKLLNDRSMVIKYGEKSYELYKNKFTMTKEHSAIENIYNRLLHRKI